MIRRFEGPAELALAAAAAVAAAAADGIAARGRFRLGLSGGRSPLGLYAALATGPFAGRVDWRRTDVLFADERAVPPDHADSNYRLVRRALIEPAGVPPGNVHRMRGESRDLEAAASAYETLLAEPLDLLVLGIGVDGHTASIFPGSPAAAEWSRRVVVVGASPRPPARRLTVTPRVIAEARSVAVLASGEDKARAVAEALEGPADAAAVPARLARERDWFVDRAAARELEGAGAARRAAGPRDPERGATS